MRYVMVGIAACTVVICDSANAQSQCDPKYLLKQEKRFVKGRPSKDARCGCEVAYDISQCYRNVSDSLHQVWVLEAIEYRKKHSHCYRRHLGGMEHVIGTMGLWYSEIGEHEQAELWLSKWIRISPNTPEPYYHHGRALLSLRRGEEALSALRTADEKQCKEPDLDSLLSEAIKASAIGGHRLQRLDSLNLTGDTWHFRSNIGLRGFIFNYGRSDYFVPNPNGAPILNEEDLQEFFKGNRDAAIQITYSQGDE